jgi:hypothetical protein
MAIEFHCDHCGHLVRTSNENAGRRGKCPHCHLSVYIPTPSEELEPLRLAPVDEAEERARERELEESRALARKLREEREAPPPEAPKPPLPEPLGDVRLPSDMEVLVTEYALCMADGRLSEAEDLAVQIRMDMRRADEYIQRLTMDELPPARLAHISRALLLGFLKQLHKLG